MSGSFGNSGLGNIGFRDTKRNSVANKASQYNVMTHNFGEECASLTATESSSQASLCHFLSKKESEDIEQHLLITLYLLGILFLRFSAKNVVAFDERLKNIEAAIMKSKEILDSHKHNSTDTENTPRANRCQSPLKQKNKEREQHLLITLCMPDPESFAKNVVAFDERLMNIEAAIRASREILVSHKNNSSYK
ncbi:hypothetical protein DdX_12375 [Ditylenchus destructor]|uniref:Uncharacterized protein n=1 Tax=Ditylenchus destructor TaxID=166010 RepID=A0AAD4MWH9_9BILA|nr:hypothetical protein DdX_12375 [Ditylenchus destructor]